MALSKLLCTFLFVAGFSPAANFDTPLDMSKAPTWQERQKALHAVLQKHGLSDPELRSGVVKLFNRETDDPKWQEEAEFDDFNQYYEEVSQICQRVAQTYHQQDAWRALVFSPYNPDSRFGKWLVSQPESLPFFLEMSKSTNTSLAGQGLQMLGEALQFCQGSNISPQCSEIAMQRNDILNAIRQKAVSDADDASDAILALGTCGDLSDITRLESRASVLQKKVIDPGDKLGLNNRQALLWLIRFANKEIRERISGKPKNRTR